MNLQFEKNKLGKRISNESQNSNKWESELVKRVEFNLEKIEKILLEKIEDLEEAISVSPQKEICSTMPSLNLDSVFKTISRIELALNRHSRAEEISLKRIKDLEKQLNEHKLILQEIQMERDVLLERVHSYLEINSSLRIRLEEQRCHSHSVVLHRHQTPDLDSEVQTLRVDNKRLGDLNIRKDVEINKMNAVLQQTTKSLEHERMEALNCKNKKNNLILILKRGFQKTLKENARLEEKRRKLMEQMLIKDSVIRQNMWEPDLAKRKTICLKRFKSMSNLDCITLPLKNFLLLSFDSSTSATPPSSYENHHCSQPCRWKSNPELNIFKKFSSSTLIESTYSYPVYQETSKTKQVFDYSYQKTQQGRKGSERINPNETLCPQLRTIKCDLENLTQKLKAVKIQLISLQLSEDTISEMEESCLMQKLIEAQSNFTLNKQKTDIKPIKDTLEEAKHLNAKLQSLKIKKQKNYGSILKKNLSQIFSQSSKRL